MSKETIAEGALSRGRNGQWSGGLYVSAYMFRGAITGQLQMSKQRLAGQAGALLGPSSLPFLAEPSIFLNELSTSLPRLI